MSKDQLKRRARGALIGTAVGDSMGAPCEGMTAEEIRRTYGKITGFVRESGAGTDDTDFTLFNAHILTTYGVAVTQEQVEWEWRDKLLSGNYPYRPGGFSDVDAVNNLREGMRSPRTGYCNHQMWSDGVAMAIGAAGVMAAGQPDIAAGLAESLGSISNARDGVYTAQAVAAAIAVAMEGADPEQMVNTGITVVPKSSWTFRALETARDIGSAGLDYDALVNRIDRELIYHWWPWADLATEAVPVAFAFFLGYAGEFERAVPSSIATGRDADTIGAIVGSLCGAYQGYDAIPKAWRERVSESQGASIGFVAGRPIVDIADQLADRVNQLADRADLLADFSDQLADQSLRSGGRRDRLSGNDRTGGQS